MDLAIAGGGLGGSWHAWALSTSWPHRSAAPVQDTGNTAGIGTWRARFYLGGRFYSYATLGTADDCVSAGGAALPSYASACAWWARSSGEWTKESRASENGRLRPIAC